MVHALPQTVLAAKLGKLVKLYALHGENWTCRIDPAETNEEG